MALSKTAPRGGLVENLAGASRVLILRNSEIERFEDMHMGVFDLWHGFVGRGSRPTWGQVRDLVALGLVGGGLTDQEADAVMGGMGLEHAQALYTIGQALLAVAFMPDVDPDGEADASGAGDTPEKT